MGRRRRKPQFFPKKRLPHIFRCPKCGKESIIVLIDKKLEDATIRCGTCGLEDIVPIKPCEERVDAYTHFIDRFFSNKLMEIST